MVWSGTSSNCGLLFQLAQNQLLMIQPTRLSFTSWNRISLDLGYLIYWFQTMDRNILQRSFREFADTWKWMVRTHISAFLTLETHHTIHDPRTYHGVIVSLHVTLLVSISENTKEQYRSYGTHFSSGLSHFCVTTSFLLDSSVHGHYMHSVLNCICFKLHVMHLQ